MAQILYISMISVPATLIPLPKWYLKMKRLLIEFDDENVNDDNEWGDEWASWLIADEIMKRVEWIEINLLNAI